MARAPLNRWLQMVASKDGPTDHRDRHLCHVLALFMRGDGSDGCFPSLRTLADSMHLNRRTVSASIERLKASGFLEAEQRQAQFGRVGSRFFPALPQRLQIGARM